jgi:AAT family amino acid transporter
VVAAAFDCSRDPDGNLSSDALNVAWRGVFLHVVPLTLLICIFPWNEAEISRSVFAAALERNGFLWAGAIFSLVVLSAAVSCSNSGLDSCSRALFALSREGLAPAWLGRTNRFGCRKRAAKVHSCFVSQLRRHI